MRVHFHKHHPCNKRFGYRATQPIGAAEHRLALWLFLGVVDVVVWL